MSSATVSKAVGNSSLRAWSNRHARLMEVIYSTFEPVLVALRPLTRVIPSKILKPVVKPAEKLIKGTMFDCHMCGNCILSSTGMSCPMNCPKNLRNGPCGGVREGGYCEITPSMPCVWVKAWKGAEQMRHGDGITRLQPPLNQGLKGRSSWIAVMQGDHTTGHGADGAKTSQALIDAKQTSKPASALQAKLNTGEFCITSEFNPPDTPDPDHIRKEADQLLKLCNSLNITDGAGANTHISSASVAALLAQAGHDPVMQVSCRDRNRIAIQADVLGAAALGIKNILCLTGDGIKQQDKTQAKPVFDLDCTSLLAMLKTMRDEGEFLSGRKLDKKPEFFLGATSNPCAIEPHIEVGRIGKKIRAGAQFIQTQYCFDMDAFKAFFTRFCDQGLHEQCHYLVGVGPLSTARAAEWMRHNIAGIKIPDEVIARLKSAKDESQEGIDICVELIGQLREIKGVAGVHIMALQQPEKVRRIIEQAKLN